MNNELYHHGVKGQRWGVRRYQNFDGSYTKAGLKRYQKSSDDYERKKNEYKAVKNDPNASKYEKQLARSKMKKAKAQEKKDYKHLAQDKKADKGKVRYNNGERIRGNEAIASNVAKAGVIIGAGAKIAQQYGLLSSRDANYALYVSGGLEAASVALRYAHAIPNSQLRAYYSHTSNY